MSYEDYCGDNSDILEIINWTKIIDRFVEENFESTKNRYTSNQSLLDYIL